MGDVRSDAIALRKTTIALKNFGTSKIMLSGTSDHISYVDHIEDGVRAVTPVLSSISSLLQREMAVSSSI